MSQRTKKIALMCAISAALLWWGILYGQTVPEKVAGAGTVLLRTYSVAVDDIEAAPLSLDTLEIRLLEIQIREREGKLEETTFWRRLLQAIHFSASYGVRDVAFIDPTSYTPYLLPRDAYRVTLSLTLNDVLFSPAHSQALLEVEKLKETLAIRRIQQARERIILEQQLRAIQTQLQFFEKEVAMVQELLRFNQLRFEQGKIEFDVLTRTKIELLNLQRSLDRLQHQQLELKLKLGTQ